MEIWDKANQFHIEGKFDEADKLYDDLLTQNPENPGLLATYGTLCLQLNRIGLAVSMLNHAVDLMRRRNQKVPGDMMCNLGLAYKYSGQHEKAVKWMKTAIDLEPTPESLVVYGSMFVENGQAEKCIKINQQALEQNEQLPLAHWNMACAMLELGQWDKAWDEYEYGFEAKSRVDRCLGDMPRWDGVSPGTVCVYGEQGIGDEIMFASMLPDITNTNPIIFECHKRLKTLFEHSFPGLICHGTREDQAITWQDEFDYQISIASLGKYYRRTADSFPGMPYLKAESAPRGKKFRVGISWTGGMKAGRVAKRTVPLNWWSKILKQDCEFVSLQYTDCEAEISETEQALGVDIQQHPGAKYDDYYECAKLVMSCDLVISVCTSVVHLAGALGVPCWVMTPAFPAWRYQNRGPMPWYKSVRLYRQPAHDVNAWIPVLDKVAEDLAGLLSKQEPKDEPKLMVAYG